MALNPDGGKWVADLDALPAQVDRASIMAGIAPNERGQYMTTLSAVLAVVQWNDSHPDNQVPTATWQSIRMSELDVLDVPDPADESDPTPPNSEVG